MRNCVEYEELISALLDGELSPEEQSEVEAHIAQCPQCAAMYDAFAAVSAVETADLPENLHTDIMNKVGMAAKAMKTQAKIVRLRRTFASAACLVVLVGTLFSIGRARPEKAANDVAGAPAVAEAPKMSMPYATESSASDDALVYEYTADMAAPAEPAAPAAPMEPAAPPMPAPMPAPPEAERGDSTYHRELAAVLMEVVSVADGALEVRADASEPTLPVLLTEETEMDEALLQTLAPGCTVEIEYDLAVAEEQGRITALKVSLAQFRMYD